VRLLTESVGSAPQTLRSRSAEAGVLTRLGRLEEADAIFSALSPAAWPTAEKAQSQARLALLRSRQGRHDEAVGLARSSREALQAHPSKIVRALAASTLGQVLLAAASPADAVIALREAQQLFEARQKIPTPDRIDVDNALLRATAALSSEPQPLTSAALAGRAR
jgi:hypothetical protein